MALVDMASFKLVGRLLPEGSASGILVQTLAERWWDTAYTFHIAEREMTVTSHDFHQIMGLRFDGPFIDLEDESGIQLGVDLLGHKYLSESICYFDLEADYRPCSQVMPDDCARIAKAFLLYLLRVYVFANGGQTISLRWLALFRDFEHAREVNWGQACLACLYSVLDTLSQGTLGQLAGP